MLVEELSPRESATDEELRAAEYFAGRFSGWGYEVGLQDFEAVEIGRRHPAGGPWAGGCRGGAVAGSGNRDGDRVWMFALSGGPVIPGKRRGMRWRGQWRTRAGARERISRGST